MMKRIFFDGKFPFCKRVADHLKKLDTKRQYHFSSLDGKIAKNLFSGNYGFLRRKKSIVLLEGNRVFVKANAVLRLYWLLGKGPQKILGSLYVIPGFLLNPFYHLLSLFIR